MTDRKGSQLDDAPSTDGLYLYGWAGGTPYKVPAELFGGGDVAEAATRTALKALDTTSVTSAVLVEAGREGIFIWQAGDYSAEVTADTAEGIYVAADGVDASEGAWVRVFNDLADVRWFGAVLDDTTDDTDAFNVALAVAKDVLFPEGAAYVTDMITVPDHGNLVGVGVGRSRFTIRGDFNMTADGVVKMGASENLGLIDKIGFEFDQPATGVRADMIQYPPAIYHNNIPRVRIGHVRFSRAWDGIDAGSNAGGAKYDYVECGTLNRGILIDGALDTIDLGYFKVWPYGIGSSGDGGTGDVFRDEENVGAEIGRVDGLEGTLALFQAGLLLNANATAGGGNPRHLHSVHLDSGGAWMEFQSGQIDIDYLYLTRNAGPTKVAIKGAGGIVRIGAVHISDAADMDTIEIASGAELYINGGRIRKTDLDKRVGSVVAGGTLAIRNTELALPGTRTVSALLTTGGDLFVQNNAVTETGTGILVEATTTNPGGGYIGGNDLNGRKLSMSTWMIGQIAQPLKGYISADGATTVRVPSGVSVTKMGTGDYRITHNRTWTQSRQHVTISPQNNSTDASAVVDQTNTTADVLRIKTYSAGAAADLPFTFEIAHT